MRCRGGNRPGAGGRNCSGLMVEWSVGAVVVGVVLALVTFVLSHAVLRNFAAPSDAPATPAD